MPNPTPTFRKIRALFLKEEGIDLGEPPSQLQATRLLMEGAVMNLRRRAVFIVNRIHTPKPVIAVLIRIQYFLVINYVNFIIWINQRKKKP